MFLLLLLVSESVCTNMNSGGVPYAISNPPGSSPNWEGTPGNYSTHFQTNVQGNVDFFDVYGEVKTVYSQVYWTRNAPINLPPEIVKRFEGKVMAITGYEVDQVTHPGPKPGSTSSAGALGGFSCYPQCDQDDQSVPIYNAYNHHYFSWLMGADAEMFERETPKFLPNPTNTGFRTREGVNHGFPTHIVFKENPGGEFRKSYHGYPSGFAQLIHSPSQWVVEPMQIDTHNRNYSITEHTGLKPSFLPQMVINNMTDLRSGLSPLIECPCTDRITKSMVTSSKIVTQGSCPQSLDSMEACTEAITATGATISSKATIHDPSWAPGCTMWPKPASSPLTYTAIFNSAASSESVCGESGSVSLSGEASLGGLVSFSLEHDTISASISLSGPAGNWFGVGFGAKAMKDKPYAIIVDGDGKVSERRLADHGPGSLLPPLVKIISNSVVDGIRTVVVGRPINGSYNLPTAPGDLHMIAAVGDTPKLAYHKARTGGKVTLLPTKDKACVCHPTSTAYLTYMDTSTQEFGVYDCLSEPRSNMKQHGDGTGREVPNQACSMDTYHGGLQCCRHSWLLTDRDQDSLIQKEKVDTYYLKWRYYFQEYTPKTENTPGSHKHLHHWVFLIDAQVNDYEEDNAEYGRESVGKITAHLPARDIGLEDLTNPTDDGAPPIGNYSTITPLVMTPHCHAPSCIRQEFWNSDTGEIICNMTAAYGSPAYGPTTAPFNEADYITILPCIYGFQPGLQFPFNLSPDTNITAIKYFNNTYRHLGQMAQWTGLMVYDTDPY